MKKLFSFLAMIFILGSGLILSACGKEKSIQVNIVGGLPAGIEKIYGYTNDNDKIYVTKSHPVIYFQPELDCKWGNLTLTVVGVKSDNSVETILQNGTYLENEEGEIKIYPDMNNSYGYKLSSSCFSTYKEVRLSFSGEAELRMTNLKLQVNETYTKFDTANLRFNVKKNGELVEIQDESFAFETNLNFEQFKALFAEDGIATPYGRTFEIDVWGINQSNLNAFSISTENYYYDKHLYKYENGLFKTVLIINEANENVITLQDSTSEWFGNPYDNFGSITLSLYESNKAADYLLGNSTQKIYAGQEEINNFNGLKSHINDKLTIKFESENDYTILDYLAENANFEFLNQKNLKLKKEAGEEGKFLYVVDNIINPFKTGDEFTFLITPVFEEIANLEGLMPAPSFIGVHFTGSGIELYDGYEKNIISLSNNDTIASYYVLKDSAFDYSYKILNSDFVKDDVISKKLSVTYAKGKTLSITLPDNLQAQASDENANLSSQIFDENGETGWLIKLHINKISACKVDIIEISLK